MPRPIGSTIRSGGSARVRSRVFTPTVAQRPIWDSNARILAAVAGHFGGKSHMGAYWIMREAHRFPGDDFVICGPSYKNLRKAAMPKLRSLMAQFGLPWEFNQALGIGFRAGDLEYRLPKGGIIYFGTAERPSSIQGAHIRAAWLDETVDTSYNIYETLLSRVAGFQGRILITTTPYDLGWLYEQVYKAWKSGEDPEIFVHQWRSVDNPAFDKAEFERLRKKLPAWRFRMLYEGQFERPAGLVYDCFENKHRIDPFDIPPDWEHFIAIDWGFSDPMAVLWVAEAPNGRQVAYDEFYETGWMNRDSEVEGRGGWVLTDEMLERIVERTARRSNYKISRVYYDPSRPEHGEKARRLFAEIGVHGVYPADTGPNTILPGIETCYGLVKNGEFEVFKALTNFWDEQSKYRWDIDEASGNPAPKSLPVDRFNHLMDCWRMLERGSQHEPAGTFAIGKID